MSDRQNPAETALDYLFYAPIGLALEARAMLPQFIDRGRKQFDNQVTMARTVGQFAVQQGQTEAEKRFGKVGEQTTLALAELGLIPRPGERAPAAPPRADQPQRPEPPPPGAGPEIRDVDLAPAPVAVADPPATAGTAAPPAAPEVATLAVPDYDSLAASQVIPRLAGLSGEELEAVRSYEMAKRGRKTILNRIAQLQSA